MFVEQINGSKFYANIFWYAFLLVSGWQQFRNEDVTANFKILSQIFHYFA